MNSEEAYSILIECLKELHEAVKDNEEVYEWESNYHSALFYLLTEKLNKKDSATWQKQLVKSEDRLFEEDTRKRLDISVYDNLTKKLLLLVELKCDFPDSLPDGNTIKEDIKKLRKVLKEQQKENNFPKAVFIYFGYTNRPAKIIDSLKKIDQKNKEINVILFHSDLEELFINENIFNHKIMENEKKSPATKNDFLDTLEIYLLDFNQWDIDDCVKDLFQSEKKRVLQRGRLYFYYNNKRKYFFSPKKIANKIGDNLVLIFYNRFRSYKGKFVGFCKLEHKNKNKHFHYLVHWPPFKNNKNEIGVDWILPLQFNKLYDYFGIKRKYDEKKKKGEKQSYPNLYKISGSKKVKLLGFLQQNVSNWNEIIKKIKSLDFK